MRWVRGRVHEAFPIDDSSRVGEARRRSAQLALTAGLDETVAGRAAIAVNELGNNLVRHAQGGTLLLAGDEGEVELIAIDRGPGIGDVPRSMQDGFSTGGTPGTGLGAVRRLSDDFDMHSVPGEGTAILARFRDPSTSSRTSGIRIGGVATAAPGEQVCGDGWAAWVGDDWATLLLADGLGHGAYAAEASAAAVDVIRSGSDATPREIVETSHGSLRSTRGAALAVLRAEPGCVKSCGAGNILGRVLSGVHDKVITTQHGTVGVQMRRAEETSTPWPPHAIVIAHSDGVESRWRAELVVPMLARDPALIAAVLLRDHARGRDDATVVVIQKGAGA